jgi:hypothetical protein
MLLARSLLIVLKLSEAADANVNGYERAQCSP